MGGAGDNGGGGKIVLPKTSSACDHGAALRKCLAENNGNSRFCRRQIEDFKVVCLGEKRRREYSLLNRPPLIAARTVTEV